MANVLLKLHVRALMDSPLRRLRPHKTLVLELIVSSRVLHAFGHAHKELRLIKQLINVFANPIILKPIWIFMVDESALNKLQLQSKQLQQLQPRHRSQLVRTLMTQAAFMSSWRKFSACAMSIGRMAGLGPEMSFPIHLRIKSALFAMFTFLITRKRASF
jgi:hypothetical protein